MAFAIHGLKSDRAHVADIEKKITGYKSKNKEDLWENVQECDSIDPLICANLVDSMCRRCTAVLKTDDAITKHL